MHIEDIPGLQAARFCEPGPFRLKTFLLIFREAVSADDGIFQGKLVEQFNGEHLRIVGESFPAVRIHRSHQPIDIGFVQTGGSFIDQRQEFF